MQYLFAKWPELSLKIKNHHVCVFLDYDGVLAPITNIPCQAVIPKETKHILRRLVDKSNLTLAIVSGRSIKNIKGMVKIKNIIYAGNHGLEVGDLQTSCEIPVSLRYKTELKRVKKELINKLAKIKGVLIEDKEFSLSLHYRLVNKAYVPTIKSIFKRAIAKLKMQDKIKIFTDKKTLEITPNILWNKGSIVSLILILLRSFFKRKKIMPIYIGDGLTDNDAFRALKKHGITIFVGASRRAQADYYLKNTLEVRELLKEILVLKTN